MHNVHIARHHLFGLLIAYLLSGCSAYNYSHKLIEESSRTGLQDETVTYVTSEPPSFSGITYLDIQLDNTGGNARVDEHGIPDPANKIAAGIIKEIETRYGAHGTAPLSIDKEGMVESDRADIRYLLMVETAYWGIATRPLSYSDFDMFYHAGASLKDTVTNEIIAQAACHILPDSDDSLTYNQMMENKAAGLLAKLDKRAKECTDTIIFKMFDPASIVPVNSDSQDY